MQKIKLLFSTLLVLFIPIVVSATIANPAGKFTADATIEIKVEPGAKYNVGVGGPTFSGTVSIRYLVVDPTTPLPIPNPNAVPNGTFVEYPDGSLTANGGIQVAAMSAWIQIDLSSATTPVIYYNVTGQK